MGRFRWPWQRREPQRRMTPFDRARLPEVKPATFEEMFEEALLMAESAARMALKNRLIVDALRSDEPYSAERAAGRAREVLYELVQEADEAAEHVAEERAIAAKREGRSQHQHDYHRDDLTNLRRREKVHAAIAKELWSRRSDDAWDELARVIEQELDRRWPRYDEEPGYEAQRTRRMAGVGTDLMRELARLEAQRAVEAIPEY